MKYGYLYTVVFALLILLPISASAATTFEVSGWMPYWRAATSSNDVSPHLSELTEINPFVYSVSSSGTIIDNGPMNVGPWPAVIAAAHAQKVRVVPTVMWSNGAVIQKILSNAKSRQALETTIANLVKANGYDGIDIDFENKPAAIKNYFSLFLKGLYMRMGNKLVTCDIEARTPIAAQYYGMEIPAGAGAYANDYTQINKYCDRVHLMTYDQQTVDSQLAAVAASSSQLYAPVADPAWVEAVVSLAEQSISPRKIIVGIPTYGYEYQVTAYANNQYLYDILWTFDPGYALQIEKQYSVIPVRNSAGEMTLTYTPLASSTAPTGPLSVGSMDGLTAAAAASLYANTYNAHLTFNMLDWSDAQSVQSKIALAKALGVRGVAIFEFDGGEDPAVWNVLQGVKQ
ncbi:MAG TPA: glycosyl hydrolase family 18 protein [Candidatus Paceibacterota bacterium]|nr:glycosyl hydrolase family 18 protein [Candidatus Paceibacterota bacterium]